MSAPSNPVSNGGSGGSRPSHHRHSGHTTHHGHHDSSRRRSTQHQQHRRHHSNGQSYGSSYYDDEDGNGRRHASHSDGGSSRGLDSGLPYGSRGGDLAPLAAATPADASSHEPTAISPGEPHTADGVYRSPRARRNGGGGGGAGMSASLRPNSAECRQAPTRHYSADRVTLDRSSSTNDGDAADKSDNDEVDPPHGNPRHGAADGCSDRSSDDSFASSESGSETEDSDSYSKRTYRDSDSESESDTSSSSSSSESLVRFGDSFRTPITVMDAEGLHSFTLSLELFGKELRRVLYGLEEMLQSL